MEDHDPPKLYTVEEAAAYLKLSSRTVWRYIDSGVFDGIESLVIIPRQKRRYVRFTEQSLDDFISKYSRPVSVEEKPKRAYHRTKKKYARTKKKNDGKKRAA